jgi:UDP-N-acetylglucosamine--N-acetylmuramyl-(pentapeptide) pyrophosphoryl-undecaprenol N-acetylglucosamine transferase
LIAYGIKKNIKRFKPDVVIGLVFLQVQLKNGKSDGYSTVIQEQNSFPGITITIKKADAICVAYENLERFFPKRKWF